MRQLPHSRLPVLGCLPRAQWCWDEACASLFARARIDCASPAWCIRRACRYSDTATAHRPPSAVCRLHQRADTCPPWLTCTAWGLGRRPRSWSRPAPPPAAAHPGPVAAARPRGAASTAGSACTAAACPAGCAPSGCSRPCRSASSAVRRGGPAAGSPRRPRRPPRPPHLAEPGEQARPRQACLLKHLREGHAKGLSIVTRVYDSRCSGEERRVLEAEPGCTLLKPVPAALLPHQRTFSWALITGRMDMSFFSMLSEV